MPEPFRLQQAAVLLCIGAATVWACTAGRETVLRRPRATLALAIAADLCYLVWVTTPFIPAGVDESYFVINGHRYWGSDLYNCWIRTPLPGLVGSASPWHPLIGGFVCKELAAVAVYAVALRALGTGPGLWAAWLTIVSTRLSRDSAVLLGEPYAAAAVAGFVFFASTLRWRAAALSAGLGFASRWQLGVLLPLGLWAGWRQRRTAGVLQTLVIAALPALVLVPWTGVDPLRALQQNRGHPDSLLDRLCGYLHPKLGFGLGGLGLALALVGIFTLLRRRSSVVAWSAAAFGCGVAAVLSVGTVMPNYTTAFVPAGAVLIAAGTVAILQWSPLGRRRWLVAVLAAAIAVLHAVPVRAPRQRAETLASPQAIVAASKSRILALLGDQPLYSEVQFLAVTAVLDHPVHAVLGPYSAHPQGVDMAWEGQFPSCERTELPAGSVVLTTVPEGHPLLWSDRGLCLVRW